MRTKADFPCLLAVLLLLLSMVSQASAAMMTYEVTFTASVFEPGVPTAPVTGHFRITLDPTQTYFDGSSITLLSLNIPMAVPCLFNYNDKPAFPRELDVGGIYIPLYGGRVLTWGVNDFLLRIGNFPASPSFISLWYVESPSKTYWNTGYVQGSVSAVPLPPTLLLFVSGLLGLATLKRR